MILQHLLVASLLSLTANAGVGDTVITVRADKKLFTLSEMMIGANMEDLHYQMVGGFDGQMLHGESFFEHSPTELAPRKAQLDGFATVNGVWTVADGVVTVTVRPDDGTPWLETGLAGGQPPLIQENRRPATSEWQLESQPVSRCFPPNPFTVIEIPIETASRSKKRTGAAMSLK